MFLITRPRYDKTTHYLFYWTGNIIQKAQRLGLTIYDLSKERASRKTVESFLIKRSPQVTIFNGHGSNETMAGQDNEIIINSKNAKLLAGKTVYMRACNAGRVLGQRIIADGSKGFVGYIEPFMFPYDKDKISRPLEDDLAKPCMECSNQIAYSLIRGSSAKEAHEEGIKKHKEKIDELSTSDMPPYIIAFLFWNISNQVYYE